ncbi:UNVERIFIED_CONTAM: Tyrosine-protein phosphatase non-receptor type 4 [Gekko kuhli]
MTEKFSKPNSNVVLYGVLINLASYDTKHDQGQVLLDVVFKHLDLTERDYFGLQLADDSTDNPRWLDPNKPIRKQLKRGSPHGLNFRVKFFVSDPNKLQEEYTRYPSFFLK